MQAYKQYYCLNCHKFVPTRHKYSAFFCFILIIIFGWFFGIGIIIAIIYYSYSPRICLYCKSGNIWEDNPKNYKKPTNLCQNYMALENGICSHYRNGSCYEVKSIQNLDVFNKRGYFCPLQDEIRESIRKQKEQQTRWVKTYEQKFIEPEQKSEQIRYICPTCGAIINQEVDYCIYCGSKIKK